MRLLAQSATKAEDWRACLGTETRQQSEEEEREGRLRSHQAWAELSAVGDMRLLQEILQKAWHVLIQRESICDRVKLLVEQSDADLT